MKDFNKHMIEVGNIDVLTAKRLSSIEVQRNYLSLSEKARERVRSIEAHFVTLANASDYFVGNAKIYAIPWVWDSTEDRRFNWIDTVDATFRVSALSSVQWDKSKYAVHVTSTMDLIAAEPPVEAHYWTGNYKSGSPSFQVSESGNLIGTDIYARFTFDGLWSLYGTVGGTYEGHWMIAGIVEATDKYRQLPHMNIL